MRIRISHDTTYSYGAPVKSAIQILRLTPRNHEGQFVARWKVDIDGEARIVRREDWYGNITHSLNIDGPASEIGIKVSGEVETEDQAGLVRGTVERFPPALFLRQTQLTTADAALADFAASATAGPVGALDKLHALMHALHDLVTFDTNATDVVTTAVQAFHAGHGVCQDFSHIFCAAARSIGIPARYVSGYLMRPGTIEQEASHAWSEAYVPDLGWISFDAANAICATDLYVRIAIGLDYLEAAPVRGSYYGAAEEHLEVKLRIDGARQTQS
ncbi:transglutaminase [Terrihabitans soli]|uniref:Transglutaminase n=1 Tax=Terrihabitans soli TaxID=708113 RepID=A0A6S6QNA1_9HYPH|nr:transglutaminase family protein [Terrihabitans soli]BCJ89397.1 transglutaminase [Terrihabitans soli]